MTLTAESPPLVLTLLAHEVRWTLLRALVHSDYRVHELGAIVGRPLNLVSYHLKQLRDHQLVTERRSSADARDLYYHLDLPYLQTLYRDSGMALHPTLIPAAPGQPTEGDLAPAAEQAAPAGPPTRILFLCTHNSARSQMAEAITRHLGQGQVQVFSAGSAPSAIHPDALRALAAIGVSAEGQAPKHMEQFAHETFDYIITVCDQVRESCPVFPNDPEHIHWSFADPAAIADGAARQRAFQQIARELNTRIRLLLALIERKRAGR